MHEFGRLLKNTTQTRLALRITECSMKTIFRLLTLLVASMPLFAWAQQDPPAPKLDESIKKSVIKEVTNILETAAFVPGVDFDKWSDLLKENAESIDKASSPDELSNTVNGMFQKFGFSHMLLFSPVAAERRAPNQMVGLGVRIQIEEKGVRVVRVFEDGAAFTAGIKAGDLIMEADGKPVSDPSKLAGEEGQSVKLKIDRNNVIIEREVVRKKFAMLIPEELSWPEPDIAHLTIPSFDAEYDAERIQGLFIKAKDAKGMILDLRGNGGGRVINLLHLSSYFLTREQPLGTFVDRTVVEKYTSETGNEKPDVVAVAEWAKTKVMPMRRNREPFQGKITVLIDGGTGSASEMMAAALKEHCGSTVIGSKSAGAVLASTMRQLPGGFLLQFPLMDYVTIKGHRLEGSGVVPDIAAPTPRYGEVDKGIEQALQILKSVGAKAA